MFTKPFKVNVGDFGFGPESCVDDEDIGSEINDINLNSSESDYDSGAFSRPSTPENCNLFEPQFYLQSPPLVLSASKQLLNACSERSLYRPPSRVNSELLLSCLKEAGKSSMIPSFSNRTLERTNVSQNSKHKHRQSSDSLTSANNITLDRCKISEFRSENDLVNKTSCEMENERKSIRSRDFNQSKCPKSCGSQVTVNGQHICYVDSI
jgi:hypothetical protein